MCVPHDTIARDDFEALARERGWTEEEIRKALAWMRERKAKRLADAAAAVESKRVSEAERELRQALDKYTSTVKGDWKGRV